MHPRYVIGDGGVECLGDASDLLAPRRQHCRPGFVYLSSSCLHTGVGREQRGGDVCWMYLYRAMVLLVAERVGSPQEADQLAKK